MARNIKQRRLLDDALKNYQESIVVLSRKVKTAVKSLDADDYSLPDLMRATKQHAETLKIILDAAPFFAAKQSLEGSAHLREWVLHSTEYTGEQRESILAAIQSYEQAILSDVGFLDREQYQLL